MQSFFKLLTVNILQKYFKERKSNVLSTDDVRALVNVPCQRLNVFAQAHEFIRG